MSTPTAQDSHSVAQQMAEAGSFDHRKYKSYAPLALKDRTWPDQQLTKAPIWCSVDLRDGNQALVNPMSVEQKVKLFNLLVKLGFKQIEIGFPSAAQPEYEFARRLIDDNLIPDDVIDRIFNKGYVVDFLNMGVGGLRTGIFNVADMYIMAGAGLVILGTWFFHGKSKAI